jgi:hypothetical protein
MQMATPLATLSLHSRLSCLHWGSYLVQLLCYIYVHQMVGFLPDGGNTLAALS